MGRKKLNEKVENLEEYLRFSYVDCKKTMQQIADELDCTPAGVLYSLRKCGIETRAASDYPTSEKVRENCRQLGHSRKGYKMPDDTKKRLSEAKKTHKMGSKKIRSHDGYVSIYYPDYPSSTKEGRVLEHVYVMEQAIGRRLRPEECVHHINHIRTDNRLENLQLMTRSEHARMHSLERSLIKKEVKI